jgi:hypothetical protein
MTEFYQNFISLLREPLSIFRLISLYWTDRYSWSFDSIHSHCHEDGIIFHSIPNILKEFWAIARYRAPQQRVIEKVAMSGNPPYCVIFRLWGSLLLLLLVWFHSMLWLLLTVLGWLYWCSPNASSPLYIASYIYANVWGHLDLCLVFRSLPAHCCASRLLRH